MSDAILHQKTVASFSNSDYIAKDYLKISQKNNWQNAKKAMWNGFLYGFGQFSLFGSISAIFYAGARFIYHFEESPEKIMIAVICLMFASLEIGYA